MYTCTNPSTKFPDSVTLDNAKKLVLRLKDEGYKAYRRQTKTKNRRILYRIYVGPYIEKDKANKSLEKISKISQSQAVLRVFDPIKH